MINWRGVKISLNFFKSFILNNKIDFVAIIALTIFTSFLVYLLIGINNQLGIYCSDVFVYLANSLNLAGIDAGSNSTLYLSPVICFLTSLLFRLGFINQTSIFTVTGSFLVIGAIGTYLFFYLTLNNLDSKSFKKNIISTNISNKLFLNKLFAILGAIIFTSFLLNILWAANGTLDIPAISISIWVMYFTVLATNKSSKYFIITFPLFVIAFFTKYTAGFILPLMLLWICLKVDLIAKFEEFLNNKTSLKSNMGYINYIKTLISSKFSSEISSKYTKNFIIGFIVAIVIFAIVLIALKFLGSSFTFFGQTQYAVTGGKGLSNDPAFNTDLFFYINHLPNFISSNNVTFQGFIPVIQEASILSYFVLSVIALAFVVALIQIIGFVCNKSFHNLNNSNNFFNSSVKGKFSGSFLFIKLFILIIISITTIITYTQISSIITEILFLIAILLSFNIFKRYKIANFDFTLLMFSWFMIYLIFFSFSDVKVERYLITTMPAIAYFFVFSIKYFVSNFGKNDIKREGSKNILKNTMILILLIFLFVFTSFVHVATIPTGNILVDTPVKVSNWLMEYDSNYMSKNIWVYSVRPYTWYLKKGVTGVYEKDLVNLEKYNVYYYISNKNYKDNPTNSNINSSTYLANYSIIKEHNGIYIYERNY